MARLIVKSPYLKGSGKGGYAPFHPAAHLWYLHYSTAAARATLISTIRKIFPPKVGKGEFPSALHPHRELGQYLEITAPRQKSPLPFCG